MMYQKYLDQLQEGVTHIKAKEKAHMNVPFLVQMKHYIQQ